MKIAVPVNDLLNVYKHNPHTAPKFAIYELVKLNNEVHFSIGSVIDNTFSLHKNHLFCSDEIMGDCSKKDKEDITHKCQHYSVLEMIGGCSYLLANHYCDNIKKSMKQSGIEVFKIPSIINKTDIAIKNFIIGGLIASKIEHIHNVS
jgi:predicted Fe-Mo cluster-binding NifX family protein